MNIAVDLLADDPDLGIEGAIRLIEESGYEELWDPGSRSMVPARDVTVALRRMRPPPAPRGDVLVYHATDAALARALLRRGFLPETKPRPLTSGYAPGRGLDRGLYVGATPRAVEGYGHVILEVDVPGSWLDVPTELRQLGERDPMAALRSHDGAVILRRVPPEAFRAWEKP